MLRIWSFYSKSFLTRCNKVSIGITKKYATSVEIDDYEVELLGNYSSSWWDPDGIMAPLHAFNKLRIPLIRDGLINCGVLDKSAATSSQSLRGISILDVGCGGGILCESLAKIGANVVGIDPSARLINIANNHVQNDLSINKKLKYVCCKIEDYVKDNINTYDVVICSEVIEHVTNKRLFLECCISTLKVNGSLFITTPSQTCLTWFSMIFIAELLNIIPKGTHQYSKLISFEDLEHLTKSLGCRTRCVQGYYYNPIINRFVWTDNKLNLYGYHGKKECI